MEENELTEKRCAYCFQLKPISEFNFKKFKRKYTNKKGITKHYEYNYYDSYCKNCHREYTTMMVALHRARKMERINEQ